ncbi:MAG TPA: hypothetical protein VHD91_12550 [Gaiellaceae bacterium]|nr:hypothetical protein [Gaiellaceae bacterium]
MGNTAEVPSDGEALRDWLRHLKEQSGASYAEIARGIDEEERTVKRWMTGQNPAIPRGDSLLRLLDFFGVTLSEPPPGAVVTSLSGELREIRNAIAHGAWSPLKVLSPADAELWNELNGNHDLDDEQLAAKLGFATVEEMSARRRELARRIASDAETQAFVLERFAGLDPNDLSRRDDRLEALEAKVDEMAQATAEALASLAAAIDGLSAQLPRAKPGSRRRKAAGDE